MKKLTPSKLKANVKDCINLIAMHMYWESNFTDYVQYVACIMDSCYYFYCDHYYSLGVTIEGMAKSFLCKTWLKDTR